MAAYFLDSSALVKRYVAETGSEWTNSLCEPARGDLLLISRVTPIETVSAIERRTRRGSISRSDAAAAIADLRHDTLHAYLVLELSPAVAAEAFDLAVAHGLRGYDAVQLATCLHAQRARLQLGLPPICLVSCDADLNAAAAAVAIPVADPNLHP